MMSALSQVARSKLHRFLLIISLLSVVSLAPNLTTPARAATTITVTSDGDTVAVGASYDEDNGPYSGSAYVFSTVGDELALDFGGNGLWHYDGTTWSRLTTWNVDDGKRDWTGGLDLFLPHQTP